MRGDNCYKKTEVYRTADCFCPEASGNRHSGGGGVPEDGHFGGNVFQLETQVFRLRNSGVAAAQTTQRREPAAQADRRRSNARQADAARGFEKKALRATERRKLVKKLIDQYRVSVRRACRVCLTTRSLYYFKLQGPRRWRTDQRDC